MKRILVKSLFVFYVILFAGHPAEARHSMMASRTGRDSSIVKTLVADMNNVNKKAVSDFKERFGNPEGTRWFSDINGFTSYFKVDNFTNKVRYDKKGNWIYSMFLYNESKLQKDVRANVKSVYYDMSIVLVKEVQTMKGKGYVINLEDKNTIRMIKVNEQGEMETIKEMSK
jgi:hypothetical protein